MKKTVTRSDLADSVHRRLGLSRTECGLLVQKILDEISLATVRGESVKVSGFATFEVRDKKMRLGRNPRTGIQVPINPRRVIRFKPSVILRDRVAHSCKNLPE